MQLSGVTPQVSLSRNMLGRQRTASSSYTIPPPCNIQVPSSPSTSSEFIDENDDIGMYCAQVRMHQLTRALNQQ